ncbi:MAG: hypothetical protein KC561_02465, partial [Myxococcales bacterium]|nr:hypothetical protein [Myxococcales bacterium]
NPLQGRTSQEISDLVEFTDDRRVTLGRSSIVPDLNGDGVADMLLQLLDRNTGQYWFRAASGAADQSFWETPSYPIESDYPVVVTDGDGDLHAVTTFQQTLRTFSADGDAEATFSSNQFGNSVAFDLTSNPGEEVLSGPSSRGNWRLHSSDGTLIWQNIQVQFDFNEQYRGTGAILSSDGEAFFIAEPRSAVGNIDHNFIVLDAADGAIRHRVTLQGGQVSLGAPTLSLLGGVGFSGLAGADGVAPILVSGEGGYLYLLDAAADPEDPSYPANLLLSVRQFGGPIGVPTGFDFDSDGRAEVFLPILGEAAQLLDKPELDVRLTIVDTDCEGADDVDEVPFNDRFCGQWTTGGSETPDGYLVQLRESDTQLLVAEQVVQEPRVSFGDLELRAENRYFLTVQGFSGSGVSARASGVASSDGCEVIDPMQPPEIVSFVVAPESFFAGTESVVFSAYARDDLRLASYLIQIFDEDDTQVRQYGGLLNRPEHTISEVWNGTIDGSVAVLPGEYLAVLTVYDFNNFVAEAQTTVTVIGGVDVADDSDMTDMGDLGGPDLGVGDAATDDLGLSADRPPSTNGCCSQASASEAAGDWWILVPLVALGVRGRRRRRV